MKKFIFTSILLGISLFASDYKDTKSYSSQNDLYVKECASCHMGFQAEFLPKRSWNKIMDSLDNHFGVDATFDKNDENAIRKHLLKNASDSKRVYREIRVFSDSISKYSTPLSISKIPKFKKEHREVPKRAIIQKELKSISNCMACHTDAKDALYNERNILIPNFGRWND